MRYTSLSVLSVLLLTTSLPALAAGGMNKHDASIATYNYDVPVILNTSTLNTGSLRDELDHGMRLPEQEVAPCPIPDLNTKPKFVTKASSTTPAMVPVTPAVMPAAPPMVVPATPKATDILPDNLSSTLPKTGTIMVPPATPTAAPPMQATPTMPEANKPAVEGMMGGQAVPTTPVAPTPTRVPLATTKGM